MRLKTLSRAAALAAAAALVVPAAAGAAEWTPYDRPADNGIVTDKDVEITMRDGIVLSADVYRPDESGRYPVIITQTPYNKVSALASVNPYLVERGYVQVVVDVRGTGGSQGTWDSFGPAEQADGPEVVEWARTQPWSDGNIGLYGPSYMAITQLTTAAQRPEGLKAIFPIVPMGDSYRDIVFSGGQTNVSFIPLWLGLVTGAGLVPPAYALSGDPEDLVRGVTTLASHVAGAVNFQTSTVANGIMGGSVAFDGPFHRTRSTIELLDQINVPAFVTGGHHDLFQRGEPLIYERLKRNVEARLLMGPWHHLTGSQGEGLAESGLPSLDQIALRWFDNYLKGIDTGIRSIPKVTQYVYGEERYETQPDWPDPRMRPERRWLRTGGQLSAEPPTGDEQPDRFVQQPLSGICTQSTNQWTAGLTDPLPCTNDNRFNEAFGGGVLYTTPPMQEDTKLSGPILADLWVTTTARDAVVSVRVTDVAPDGSSRELSGGWLAGSFRATDPRRARVVHGQLMQPWHPFTRESVLPVTPGEPTELPIEVFPVNAVIPQGHRLRVAVNPSDFPHSLPPLPQLSGSLGGTVSVLHDAEHPSYVALPTLGSCIRATRRDRRARRAVEGCRMLRTPRLTRR